MRQKNKNQNQAYSNLSIVFVVLIWISSFLISSPLFVFNTLEDSSMEINLHNIEFNASNTENENNASESVNRYGYLVYCVEKWPHAYSRILFSCFSLLVQYILPILIVGVAYGQIWWKLKRHRSKLRSYYTVSMHKNSDVVETKASEGCETQGLTLLPKQQQTAAKAKNLQQSDDMRQRKMNVLLAFIAIIFAASWLPLNIFNILSDSKSGFMKPNYGFYLINSICILFAMSSAVSNPFLYGFLNENFKREYVKLFDKIKIRYLKSVNSKRTIEFENEGVAAKHRESADF